MYGNIQVLLGEVKYITINYQVSIFIDSQEPLHSTVMNLPRYYSILVKNYSHNSKYSIFYFRKLS